MEFHVKLNDVGSTNSLFEFWFDGNIIHTASGIDFRHNPNKKINMIMLADNTFNVGATVPPEQWIAIDDLVISTSYIGPDITPPSAITNLSASNPTPSSVTLNWTSPGNDGNSGTASEYDIRYSTSIITDAHWPSAAQVSGEPAPLVAGTTQSYTVTGLSPNTTYYFAIKTRDKVLTNWSGLSNVCQVTTQADTSLALSGVPGNRLIRLTWSVSASLPVTSTWQIEYYSQTATLPPSTTGILSPTRAYTLTGLTNYAWYTVTLNAMLGSAPFLTDTVRVMPTDILMYLPLVLKEP